MLNEDKYNEIERYLSDEMSNAEKKNFEQKLTTDNKLTQTLAVYQDMSNQLQDVNDNLDFNQKLIKAAKDYQSTQKPSQRGNNNRRWLIALLIIAIGGLVWWQFLNKTETKRLPTDVPIASLWEATEMPSSTTLRGNGDVSKDEKYLSQAFGSYQNKDFTTTINYLDSIQNTASIYSKSQLLRGVAHYELKNYNEAVAAYDNYLNDKANAEDMALWYQALAYLQNKDEAKASQNLQKIIDEDYTMASKAQEVLDILK